MMWIWQQDQSTDNIEVYQKFDEKIDLKQTAEGPNKKDFKKIIFPFSAKVPPVPVNIPFTIHEQDKALIRENVVAATVQV